MIENKKLCLIAFVMSSLIIGLLPSVFAISNYDQTVYKINSNYKNNYENARIYSGACCNYNYYPLHSKGSYYSWDLKNDYSRKSYLQNNYIEKSYMKNKKGFLGTYVKEYTVEIKNLGRTGEYFIVTFNLEDKNGFERKESVTNYIRTGEAEKFVYRDVQFEKNEILHWGYRIEGIN